MLPDVAECCLCNHRRSEEVCLPRHVVSRQDNGTVGEISFWPRKPHSSCTQKPSRCWSKDACTQLAAITRLSRAKPGASGRSAELELDMPLSCLYRKMSSTHLLRCNSKLSVSLGCLKATKAHICLTYASRTLPTPATFLCKFITAEAAGCLANPQQRIPRSQPRLKADSPQTARTRACKSSCCCQVAAGRQKTVAESLCRVACGSLYVWSRCTCYHLLPRYSFCLHAHTEKQCPALFAPVSAACGTEAVK